MPAYNFSARQRVADINLGLRVDRADATHAAATTPYFNIIGGKVLMTGLVGQINTASGANLCSWEANPTTGTAQPVCADLDINPALIGDALTITGVGTEAMTYNASVSGLPMMSARGVVLNVGTLDLIAAAADGATSWSLFYVPLEDGA